ncbi:aldehyde dehydrogenase family protein [Streptomyces sp. WI04-05B]|uniref:aldehyde dehydrogenase family protein n=1 Tax=Streptomyces TaxID=1883 RepID=UPI0029BDD58A|nr:MULTISPECIES: aldehyde dehydrogenase family protein [unclassified Streptomyces]MDX2541470.1 aldehyde dehydrogenase family protein [Streptomyces sp. WI04-05B]MDX2583796.1 aldehyde dehydrogenase family protein [Streptomyces sp. WI04-05A]
MVTVDVKLHQDRAERDLPRPRLVIGGKDLHDTSGGSYEHINPATGLVQAHVPLAGPTEVDQAVAAARQAFEVWGSMRPAERRRLLTRFAGLLRDHIPDFAAICPLENGVCIGGWAENVGLHVAEWTEYYAGWADKIEGMVGAACSPHENVEYTIAEPYGVIGHIITWNSPALSLAMKVPPSLAAGNTVVIKPAESTPFSALLFADLAREAGIPDGVINVVTGLGDAGEALVAHPGVDKISFTGGPATARRIMATAARSLKPVLFELGGKSANLLFADTDLDTVVPYCAAFAMSNTGQGCALPTRLLVERPIYEEVVARVTAVVAHLPVGDPLDPATYIGPLIDEAARNRVRDMVDKAVEDRAGRLVYGGERIDSDGWFVTPTVFADVDNRSDLAQQEVFGPVLAITPFDTEDQAVALANDSEYGLSAYIQSRDIGRVNRLVPRLKAGTVYVNPGPNPITSPATPFGGVGMSGFGREGGKAGLDEFVNVKGVGIGRV